MSSRESDDWVSKLFEAVDIDGIAAQMSARGLSDDEILAELQGRVESSLHESLDSATSKGVFFYRRHQPRFVRQTNRFRRSFEKRLHKRWRKPLDLYLSVYTLCLRSGSDYTKRGPAPDEIHRFVALRDLHARACTITSEIGALLRSGHTVGALTRWRTLYEIAVVADLVGANDDTLAERFLRHDDVENYKDALEHNRNAVPLGAESFSPETIDNLRVRQDEARAKFGRRFGDAWGWAAPLFPEGQSVEFKALAERSGLDHLRPYYKWATRTSHGGAKGTRLNVRNLNGQPVLTAGPSNAGLAEPGSNALISLMQVTVSLLFRGRGGPVHPDDLVQARIIQQLVDDANDAFFEAAEVLEKDVDRFGSAYTLP